MYATVPCTQQFHVRNSSMYATVPCTQQERECEYGNTTMARIDLAFNFVLNSIDILSNFVTDVFVFKLIQLLDQYKLCLMFTKVLTTMIKFTQVKLS